MVSHTAFFHVMGPDSGATADEGVAELTCSADMQNRVHHWLFSQNGWVRASTWKHTECSTFVRLGLYFLLRSTLH